MKNCIFKGYYLKVQFFSNLSETIFYLVLLYLRLLYILSCSISSTLTRLKPLKVSISYIEILKNRIFEGHYQKPQFSQIYQKQLFTLFSLYLWYLYIRLVIIINIDTIKATESLHISHWNFEKSYFKGFWNNNFSQICQKQLFYFVSIICTLCCSLLSTLTQLKAVKVSIFYIQILKNRTFKGHYLK